MVQACDLELFKLLSVFIPVFIIMKIAVGFHCICFSRCLSKLSKSMTIYIALNNNCNKFSIIWTINEAINDPEIAMGFTWSVAVLCGARMTLYYPPGNTILQPALTPSKTLTITKTLPEAYMYATVGWSKNWTRVLHCSSPAFYILRHKGKRRPIVIFRFPGFA